MRKMDVAGWSRCYWKSDLEGLASPGAGEEAVGVLASGCLVEGEGEEEEVGELPIPLWCHSQNCGRGCR